MPDYADPRARIYQRIISEMRTTPKGEEEELPPPADPLQNYLGDAGSPAPAPTGGDLPDPSTFEVVRHKTEGIMFRDPATGKIWTGMDLRKLPGHEAKLYEGMQKQSFGK